MPEIVAKGASLEIMVSAAFCRYGVRPRMLFLLAGMVIEVGVAVAELARVAVAVLPRVAVALAGDELVEATTLKRITTG